MNRKLPPPDWERLRALAEVQGGFFSTDQAHGCGFSNQLLRHHLGSRRLVRVRRRIYRLPDLPQRHPRLYEAWLTTRGQGCFSHGTALWLHGLRDGPAEPYHMILPPSWRSTEMALPPWVRVHFRELDPAERVSLQGVAVTTVDRATQDAAEEGSP